MDLDSSLRFDEDPEVYRPSDDTYLLLGAIEVRTGERFLEVGAGSGMIALHAARTATTVATDLNPRAVRLLGINAGRNRVPLAVVRCDLASALQGPFDVVAFNPPYLEGMPAGPLDAAWAGGRDGSEVSLRFVDDLARILALEGRAYLLLRDTNAAAWSAAHGAFRAKVIASKSLFFETLHVLELRRTE